VLKGTAGILAQTFAGSSLLRAATQVANLTASTNANSIGSDARQRKNWVELAETLKPRLTRTVQNPPFIVRAVADSTKYLRWRMDADDVGPSLHERLLRKGDSFILDFGGHRAGQLEFDLLGEGTSVDSPARLRFTFGEVPGDVAEPLYPYHGELSSAWLPIDTITVDYLPQHVRLPRRYSFRYVKFEVLDTSPHFGVRFANTHAIAFSSTTLTPQQLSPDQPEWLRQIDQVSLATLRDCMQTVFEDGPRRDQRLWIGDLRLQARANYVTFKNYDLVKRCLYLFAGLPREKDGFLPACVFEKPVPVTTNTFILDYAALYGAIVLDYLHATGDRATAKDLWPVVRRQLDILLGFNDAANLFQIPPDAWAFIDWNAQLDKAASMQGVIVYALRRVYELAQMIDTEKEVAHYPQLIDKMVKAGRDTYYDATRGVCVSGPSRQISWASQAWMVLSGCMDAKESAIALRKAVLENKTAIRPTTAYLYHHVTEAMVEAGMRKEALQLIRGYWGGMVDAGADTFWEAYDPEDSKFSPYGDVHINSFCHAWSCTPTYFFRCSHRLLEPAESSRS
jgi:hypothetical protein